MTTPRALPAAWILTAAAAACTDPSGAATAPRAAWRPTDDALSIDRGGAVERIETLPEGVEQSWTFAAPPPGHGALTVRVPVRGARYAGATAAGLHFADAATGLGVRYGAA